MSEDGGLKALLSLQGAAGSRVGPERVKLLAAIREHGAIAGAAKACGLSYKGAWDAVQALNNLSPRPLVSAHTGGKGGGAATVTAAGETVLAAYARLEADLADAAARLRRALDADDAGLAPLWSLGMKTSARNAYRGVVETVREGAVNSEVTLRAAPGFAIVAVVTRASVEALDLKPGAPATALIKSSFVILAPGPAPHTSARNAFAGRVIRHEAGVVNDEVTLEIADGKTITATVTRESGETLEFAAGSEASALVKASHVILAVD